MAKKAKKSKKGPKKAKKAKSPIVTFKPGVERLVPPGAH